MYSQERCSCCHAAMQCLLGRCQHKGEGGILCVSAAPSTSAREAVVAAVTGRVPTAQALIVMDQKTVTGRSERVFVLICANLIKSPSRIYTPPPRHHGPALPVPAPATALSAVLYFAHDD